MFEEAGNDVRALEQERVSDASSHKRALETPYLRLFVSLRNLSRFPHSTATQRLHTGARRSILLGLNIHGT